MANGESVSPKVIGTLMGILGMTAGFVPSYFIANTGIEVLKTQINSLEERIQNGMTDRYRGADASRDFQRVEERDAGMREAIKANAMQIEKLETLMREHVSERGVHNE